MTFASEYPGRYVGDGFEVLPPPPSGGSPTVQVQYWSPDLERVLEESGASRVWIDRFWEQRGPGLAFLAKFAHQIERLEISSDKIGSLAAVPVLQNLEELSLECPVETLDFGKLHRLKRCVLAHPASVGNVYACPSLESLSFVRVKINDLTGLAELIRLRRLYLNELRLATLEGLQGVPLEDLHLVHLNHLRSIAPITRLEALRTLVVIGCGRIADFARVGEVRSLETLRIFNGPDLRSLEFVGDLAGLQELSIGNTVIGVPSASAIPLTRLRNLRVLKLSRARQLTDLERLGEIASLEFFGLDRARELSSLGFLRHLSNLRELAVTRTDIGDGDLGVLLELPRLERIHAISPHRSHYSHSADQLDAVLAARHPTRASSRSNDAVEAAHEVFDGLTARGQTPDDSAKNALAEDLAQRRFEELIHHFGSWEALLTAVTAAVQVLVAEKALRGSFDETVTIAGWPVSAKGRVVRGKVRVEMIRYLPDPEAPGR